MGNGPSHVLHTWFILRNAIHWRLLSHESLLSGIRCDKIHTNSLYVYINNEKQYLLYGYGLTDISQFHALKRNCRRKITTPGLRPPYVSCWVTYGREVICGKTLSSHKYNSIDTQSLLKYLHSIHLGMQVLAMSNYHLVITTIHGWAWRSLHAWQEWIHEPHVLSCICLDDGIYIFYPPQIARTMLYCHIISHEDETINMLISESILTVIIRILG